MRFVGMTGGALFFYATAAMAQAPAFQPVGTVRQGALGIVKNTSDVIFKFQFDPASPAMLGPRSGIMR